MNECMKRRQPTDKSKKNEGGGATRCGQNGGKERAREVRATQVGRELKGPPDTHGTDWHSGWALRKNQVMSGAKGQIDQLIPSSPIINYLCWAAACVCMDQIGRSCGPTRPCLTPFCPFDLQKNSPLRLSLDPLRTSSLRKLQEHLFSCLVFQDCEWPQQEK
jgi:hypothetical protein